MDGVFKGVGHLGEGMSGLLEGDVLGAALGATNFARDLGGGMVNFASSAIGSAGETLDSIFILKPAGFLFNSTAKALDTVGNIASNETVVALKPLRYGRFFGSGRQMTVFTAAEAQVWAGNCVHA
eukprot:SAG31_NODE_1964_length_6799_cov_2.549552_5_plen_125_part_00